MFDFRDACEGHDKCYGKKWGTWRYKCDRKFYNDMVDTCPPTRIYPGGCNSLLPWPSIPNPYERGCHAAAKIYFLAVKNLGRRAFITAQMDRIGQCKLGSRAACIKDLERRAEYP